jgi:hypothetical protein
MYTYGGDATLDGEVNIDDYTTVLDANIGNQRPPFFTASPPLARIADGPPRSPSSSWQAQWSCSETSRCYVAAGVPPDQGGTFPAPAVYISHVGQVGQRGHLTSLGRISVREERTK